MTAVSSSVPRRRRPVRVLGTLGAVLGLSIARPADAADVRTISRTFGEGYMVRVPGPEGALLSRRRLVQYIGLGVYRLLPPKRADELARAPEDGQLQIVTSLRIRHDFGTFTRRATGPGASTLQSLDGRQIDLMYGYLEGQNMAGVVDFRAGRQFEMSGLDFYAFDGGWIRARSPAHLAVEAFGGFAVDGTAVFGFPTFELDGTNDQPSDHAPTPMVGTAFSLVDVKWMDARFAWRRTFTPASMAKDLVAPDGTMGLSTGMDQEFVSGTIALRLAGGKLSPTAALRYDLGTSRLSDASAAINWSVSEIHTLRAQYIRTVPIFDLDSIFNVFMTEPIEDVRAVYEVRPGPHWTLYGRFQGRVFRSHTTASGLVPDDDTRFGGGGGGGATYRRRRFAARADLYGLGGYGGMRIGGDIDTRTHVVYDRFGIDARAYAVYYEDEVTPDRNGWSVALQAGGNLRIAHGVYLNLMGEQMFTPFYRTAFRALGVLSVDWSFRGGRR
jgi:hypothetical protein